MDYPDSTSLDRGLVPHLTIQVSQLELLVKERGHILEKSPKGHPELAGVLELNIVGAKPKCTFDETRSNVLSMVLRPSS